MRRHVVLAALLLAGYLGLSGTRLAATGPAARSGASATYMMLAHGPTRDAFCNSMPTPC